MKNITEWDHVEWSIAIMAFVIADLIIQHVGKYVGFGLAYFVILFSS